jgi:hypothetical protein
MDKSHYRRYTAGAVCTSSLYLQSFVSREKSSASRVAGFVKDLRNRTRLNNGGTCILLLKWDSVYSSL